jgi:oligosaccharide translocation protein RFT1
MGDLLTTIRVKAEAMGMTGKTTTTFLILWYDLKKGPRSGELSLLAFACGQLANGVVVLVTYLVYFREVHWWPKRIALDPRILRLSLTMTAQSVFKHVLTEGDKFILSHLSPLQGQGGYAIAANYGGLYLMFSDSNSDRFSGSLVARIVFQPMEETLRLYFSKTLSPPQRASSVSAIRANAIFRPSRTSLQQASNALVSLLAIQISLGIILVNFGSAYIFIILHVLLPPQYLSTSAPDVLGAWIWYIPVLAMNGGLEAFVASVALPKDLSRQSRYAILPD